MANEFSLSEIPKIGFEELLRHKNDGTLSYPIIENLRALCITSYETIWSRERTAGFDEKLKTLSYGVLLGHLNKVVQLSTSILNLGSQGKHGETIEIIGHQLHRTAIQCAWIMAKPDERVNLYVKASLTQEKLNYDYLKGQNPERAGSFKMHVNKFFQRAGFDIETFEGSTSPLPAFAEMAKEVGVSDEIAASLKNSGYGVGTTFFDLMKHYLEDRPDIFSPRESPNVPKTYFTSAVCISLSDSMRIFAENTFIDPELKSQILSYFVEFKEWCEYIHRFIFDASQLPPAQLKAKYQRDSDERLTSTIAQHKMINKDLIPPFLQIDKISFTSWSNDRMPEMLWGLLLLEGLGRKKALAVFRDVIAYHQDNPQLEGEVTISGLSNLGHDLENILKIITAEPEAKKALSHLRVLGDFPGSKVWQKLIGFKRGGNANYSWNFLLRALTPGLNHQSQESTDCRWLRVACKIVSEKCFVSQKFAKEVLGYPNVGDQRGVRPSIRANEQAFAITALGTPWAKMFWATCFKETKCLAEMPRIHRKKVGHARVTIASLDSLIKDVHHGYLDNLPSTAIEPKYDTLWGTTLYVLEIAQQVLKNSESDITGILAIRSIAEAIINLKYLIIADDAALWETYRNYGVGQAKLIVLKKRESKKSPLFIPIDRLEQIANEDRWEEFTKVDLGDWSNANLRDRSIKGKTKAIYDDYYVWPSSVSHSQWGAIRSVVFENCRNPLHRLHRVPVRASPSISSKFDIGILVETIVDTINSQFPNLKLNLSAPTSFRPAKKDKKVPQRTKGSSR